MRATLEDLAITIGLTSSLAMFTLLLNRSLAPARSVQVTGCPVTEASHPVTLERLRDSLAPARRADGGARTPPSHVTRCTEEPAPGRSRPVNSPGRPRWRW
jgi:hypothetical protein